MCLRNTRWSGHILWWPQSICSQSGGESRTSNELCKPLVRETMKERRWVARENHFLGNNRLLKGFIKVCSRRYNETHFLCPYGTSRKITASLMQIKLNLGLALYRSAKPPSKWEWREKSSYPGSSHIGVHKSPSFLNLLVTEARLSISARVDTLNIMTWHSLPGYICNNRN